MHEHAFTQPQLPVVTSDTLRSVIIGLSAEPGLQEAAWWRMFAQNEALGKYMEDYIRYSSNDTEVRKRMIGAVILPYIMLEAQMEADNNKA